MRLAHRACKQQAGDVGSGDQEQTEHGPHQCQDRRLRLFSHFPEERLDLGRIFGIGGRIGPGQTAADDIQMPLRLLQAEAQNKEAYPELEGYDWADLEEPIFGAINYLIQQQGAKGVKNPQATPAEVMGLVNAAFKAHHDKVAKRGGRPAAEPPPPPQKKKPTLAPVVPASSGGKVRLPTPDVVEQRVARASAGR